MSDRDGGESEYRNQGEQERYRADFGPGGEYGSSPGDYGQQGDYSQRGDFGQRVDYSRRSNSLAHCCPGFKALEQRHSPCFQ
jgi:hypothetical protein